MKLATKLALLLLALSIAPLTLVGYLAFDNGRRTIEASTLNQLIATTNLKRAEFERWVANNIQQLEALAQRPQLAAHTAALSRREVDEQAFEMASQRLLQDHLLPNLRSARSFGNLSILSLDTGEILLSTDAGLEGRFREHETYFMEGQLATYVDQVKYDLALGEPVMHFSTPVYDEAGALIAVLVGHANLDEMSSIMVQGRELTTSEDTYLVNTFNFFVTVPRFDEPRAVLTRATYTTGVVDCLTGNDGFGFYDDYRGIPVLGVYRWMAGRELCIITEIDQDEAFAPIEALRNIVIAIGIGVAAVVSLLALWFARSITGPVRQLAAGAEEFGRGNLDHRIKVSTQDELGDLAASFNVMAANLRQSSGEVAYGRRMLLSLSEVAQKIQLAHTPQDVYQTIADEVSELDYQALVFTVSQDRSQLELTYLKLDSNLLLAAERLAGIDVSGSRWDIVPGDTYDQVLSSQQPQFVQNMAEHLIDVLPPLARPAAPQIVAMLGLERAIYAPLVAEDEAFAMLVVAGPDLSESDIPAINTLANQAAIAVQNAKLYEALQRHADHLEELVRARTADLQESEERFRTAFEHAAIGRTLAAPDGTSLQVNPALCEMLGYTEAELLAMSWLELIHPDYLALVQQQIDDLYQGTIPAWELELETLHRQGHGIWVHLNVVLIRDQSGQPLYMVGDIEDITERKRAHELLLQQQDRFLAILDNYPEILYVADLETYEVLFVNRYFRDILGRDPVGSHCYEAFQGFKAPCEFCTNATIQQMKGQPYVWEHHNPVLDRYYQLTDQIILWPDGREVRFEVGLDITERKRAEEALAQRTEDLARSNEELHQFAYVASHDLQEPLRMVTSYLQLLENRYQDQLDTDANEFIAYAVDGATRMKTLIQDLLTYSRVGTRGKPFAPIDCNVVLRRTLGDMSMAIQEVDALITVDPLPTIMADETQLAQLFQNLIGNAIKFRGEQRPEIHVSAHTENDEWVFTVRDNGIGIDPQFSDRIFIIFQRLHSRREYPGTGIGLAVCKKIVERHGGRIGVESQPGEGATFYVTLPVIRESVQRTAGVL